MKPVVYGLIAKRAETVGQIEAAQELLSRLMADLGHLDASIRIFDPEIDLDVLPMKRVPPPNAAFRGEVQRFLLNTLRTVSGPLTTLQLATAVMQNRHLNVQDRDLHRKISERTGHSLAKLRAKGFVTADKAGTGGLLRWSVSRDGEPVGAWRNGHS